MMKAITLLFTLLVLVSNSSTAQQWDTVANFNSYITCLKSFNGKLFIGGDFTKSTDNTSNSYWSASFDGTTLSPHTTLVNGSGIDDFEVFNSELYAASGMVFTLVGQGVVKWNGTSWDFANSIQNINYSDLYADGNDLYASTPDGNVYKKTGTGPFTLFTTVTGEVKNIIRYQSDLIFCGQFSAIGGVTASHIAKWNGTAFQTLGTGLGSQAFCLEVYNNELYVGGWFSTAGGVSAKSIAKWNGATWSSVSGSVTGTNLNGIRDMKKTSTGLVVVGDFDQIGGVNANHVAKWNGTAWVSMGLTHEEALISCVEEFNNIIYVGGFDVGLPNTCRLYKFKNNVAVENIKEANTVSIWPNPTSSMTHITWEKENFKTITVYSISGQEIKNISVKDLKSATIDLGQYPIGVYFVTLSSPGQLLTKEIIKQ